MQLLYINILLNNGLSLLSRLFNTLASLLPVFSSIKPIIENTVKFPI